MIDNNEENRIKRIGAEQSRAQRLCSPSGCRTMEERDRSPAGECVTSHMHPEVPETGSACMMHDTANERGRKETAEVENLYFSF